MIKRGKFYCILPKNWFVDFKGYHKDRELMIKKNFAICGSLITGRGYLLERIMLLDRYFITVALGT